MAEISLVIPTLGESTLLPRLLQSVSQQSHTFEIEVLLVDNSQNDFVKEKLTKLKQSFPSLNLKLFHIAHRGVNYARNFGLRQSGGQIVFFVDDDCWFKDIYLLKKHVQFHLNDPELFAVGGLYRLGENAQFLDRCYHAIQMRWLYEGRNQNGLSRHLIGGHFSIKKIICETHQLQFNEAIQYGGSELSFFLEAYRAKLKMKLETLDLIHETHISFKVLTQKVYKQGRGKALLSPDLKSLDQSSRFVEIGNPIYRFVTHYLNCVFQFGYLRETHPDWSSLKILRRIFYDGLKFRRDMIIRWMDEKTSVKKDL